MRPYPQGDEVEVPEMLAQMAATRVEKISLVDRASDIHLKRDYLSGPIQTLQLYDWETAAFVRPKD
jgi:hypothetical protein